jgi:HEPN domain-containing protein
MKGNTKGWVFFAENDMKLADFSLSDARLTGQVAFHSQQAIEKYFKAYLVENEISFPKMHDLVKLYEFIKNVKDWKLDEDMLLKINKIYSESRYPSNIGILPDGQIPSVEQAKEIFDFAKKIETIFKDLIENLTTL